MGRSTISGNLFRKAACTAESVNVQVRKSTFRCEKCLCILQKTLNRPYKLLNGTGKCLCRGLNGLLFFITELDTSLGSGSIVRIRTLFPGQPAEESRKIREGDVILSINGEPLKASAAVTEEFSFRGAASSLPSCSRYLEIDQHRQ
uniref:PDZ domain-containing protein n=1 Tax=Cyprinus carpio TaxID=7962 RepID=A0A8C2Q5A7_CYPCA